MAKRLSARQDLSISTLFVDCASGEVTRLCPPRKAWKIKAPEEYGDQWSDCLEADELTELRGYFGRVEHLRQCFGFLTFRVGGREQDFD